MLPTWYSTYKIFIDNSIKSYLTDYLSENLSTPLNNFKEIIFYATSSGKRVRAILALETYLKLSNKNIEEIKQDDDIIKVCIALELIHAYSLIHDDLPCMDNDDYRRWQLTVWKKYGETNAVLCGDLLNTLTFEILSTIQDNEKLKKIINLISKATSIYWMIWWQIEDIYFEKNWDELNIDLLKWLHNKKTWKLIEASVLTWIIIAWKKEYTEKLSKFWKNIWLAFQVKDDILDVEWTFEKTGKSVWWEKKWFVHFVWLKKSKEYLNKLSIEALEDIKEIKSEKLEFLVEYIKNRSS